MYYEQVKSKKEGVTKDQLYREKTDIVIDMCKMYRKGLETTPLERSYDFDRMKAILDEVIEPLMEYRWKMLE
jgi:hypothetical protein